MVEPSKVNRDRFVRVYGADVKNQEPWQTYVGWEKDRWSMRFFQYGNAFLPDGQNTSGLLAVSTIAVGAGHDRSTGLWRVKPTSVL